MRIPFILLTLIAFNHFGILTFEQIKNASNWHFFFGVALIWFAGVADANEAFPPRGKT